MNTATYQLLQRLIDSPSPSGFETPVQQCVRQELGRYADDVRIDLHGNLIAALNQAGSPRLMLLAHCDEIGLIIRYIDEQGYLYFAPIGGFDTATLPGSRVTLHASTGPVPGIIGAQPIHLAGHDERGKALRYEDMWIDIGAVNREEAQQLVPLGTPVTRAMQLEPLRGDLVVSRALDNKAGLCSIMLALQRIHAQRDNLKAALFVVSAVQEEVGSRGARTSAYTVHPDIAITVDVTFASDYPQTSPQRLGDVKLGGGPGITLGGFVNGRISQQLISLAHEAGMAFQYDIQGSYTGTDNDTIQVIHGGVATGLLNIPSRYMHSGSEIVALTDIDATAELMARFALSLDEDAK